MPHHATFCHALILSMTMAISTLAAATNQPTFFKAAIGRSPFLQPGETLTAPLRPNRLDRQNNLVNSPNPMPQIAPGTIIPWNQARRYLGQTITIEGKVVVAHQPRKKQVCFLNFTPKWRGRFYVILFKKALGHWDAPPQDYFLNKTIRVTGKIQHHNQTPQIRVTNPNQIQIVISK